MLNVGPFGPTKDYSHMGALYGLFCIGRAGLMGMDLHSIPYKKSYIFGLMFYWLNNANGMVVGSINFFKLRLGWIRDQVIGQTHIINHNKIEIM